MLGGSYCLCPENRCATLSAVAYRAVLPSVSVKRYAIWMLALLPVPLVDVRGEAALAGPLRPRARQAPANRVHVHLVIEWQVREILRGNLDHVYQRALPFHLGQRTNVPLVSDVEGRIVVGAAVATSPAVVRPWRQAALELVEPGRLASGCSNRDGRSPGASAWARRTGVQEPRRPAAGPPTGGP